MSHDGGVGAQDQRVGAGVQREPAHGAVLGHLAAEDRLGVTAFAMPALVERLASRRDRGHVAAADSECGGQAAVGDPILSFAEQGLPPLDASSQLGGQHGVQVLSDARHRGLSRFTEGEEALSAPLPELVGIDADALDGRGVVPLEVSDGDDDLGVELLLLAEAPDHRQALEGAPGDEAVSAADVVEGVAIVLIDRPVRADEQNDRRFLRGRRVTNPVGDPLLDSARRRSPEALVLDQAREGGAHDRIGSQHGQDSPGPAPLQQLLGDQGQLDLASGVSDQVCQGRGADDPVADHPGHEARVTMRGTVLAGVGDPVKAVVALQQGPGGFGVVIEVAQVVLLEPPTARLSAGDSLLHLGGAHVLSSCAHSVCLAHVTA